MKNEIKWTSSVKFVLVKAKKFSHITKGVRKMFRATSICMSAMSKRTNKVKVQLLKDFPMFQLFKGQVVQVKPSFMRNYLHNYNGARYILSESDLDRDLLNKSAELEVMRNKATKIVRVGKATAETKIVEETTEVNESATKNSEQEPKGILEKEITIKDVKIPGLDL